MTISSETSSPRCMMPLTRWPSSEPEAIAARSMSPVESWTMLRASTRRLAWVPFPAAGGPNRIRFIQALPTGALVGAVRYVSQAGLAAAAAQLRLLDQALVLVRQQVRLDLGHGIHGRH
jgi:hypothetical protein